MLATPSERISEEDVLYSHNLMGMPHSKWQHLLCCSLICIHLYIHMINLETNQKSLTVARSQVRVNCNEVPQTWGSDALTIVTVICEQVITSENNHL